MAKYKKPKKEYKFFDVSDYPVKTIETLSLEQLNDNKSPIERTKTLYYLRLETGRTVKKYFRYGHEREAWHTVPEEDWFEVSKSRYDAEENKSNKRTKQEKFYRGLYEDYEYLVNGLKEDPENDGLMEELALVLDKMVDSCFEFSIGLNNMYDAYMLDLFESVARKFEQHARNFHFERQDVRAKKKAVRASKTRAKKNKKRRELEDKKRELERELANL